jgi:hypothetical protein
MEFFPCHPSSALWSWGGSWIFRKSMHSASLWYTPKQMKFYAVGVKGRSSALVTFIGWQGQDSSPLCHKWLHGVLPGPRASFAFVSCRYGKNCWGSDRSGSHCLLGCDALQFDRWVPIFMNGIYLPKYTESYSKITEIKTNTNPLKTKRICFI